MHFEILTLRVLHVLSGIFWMGSGLFTSLFLLPALTLAGSPPGPLFAALSKKRLFAALPAAAAVTVLSGLRLMWITSGGSFAAYVATSVGRTFALGGAAAIAAFVVSAVFARPSSQRAGAIGATLGTLAGDERARAAAEMARLQRRGALASRFSLIFMLLAGTAMAVARYVA
jgi:uncharacterized membrane protein